jgi:RNA polymerase sigma factor (sigma-70 family)
VDGVVEPDPVLGDELHGDRRDERLRHASDPEAVLRNGEPAADLRVAGGDDDALAVLFDERDHRRNRGRGHQLISCPLELRLGRRRGSGQEGARERQSGDQPHDRDTRRDVISLRGVTSGAFAVYEGHMASQYSIELPLSLVRSEGEADLVSRAARGDHQAYAELVRPYERLVYRVAVVITGGSSDAEEASQNGLIKAYRSLDRFTPGAAFRPWLLRIVVNAAHNVVRSARRHERLGARAREQHDAAIAGPEDAVVAREEVESVLDALGRLSDADRLAVALRYFAELPDAEAAALTGTSTEAYRVRLLRARRRLETILEGSR